VLGDDAGKNHDGEPPLGDEAGKKHHDGESREVTLLLLSSSFDVNQREVGFLLFLSIDDEVAKRTTRLQRRRRGCRDDGKVVERRFWGEFFAPDRVKFGGL